MESIKVNGYLEIKTETCHQTVQFTKTNSIEALDSQKVVEPVNKMITQGLKLVSNPWNQVVLLVKLEDILIEIGKTIIRC